MAEKVTKRILFGIRKKRYLLKALDKIVVNLK